MLLNNKRNNKDISHLSKSRFRKGKGKSITEGFQTLKELGELVLETGVR